MRIGNYELVINPGCELDGAYVELRHGQHYNLNLSNRASTRCDADITIDGKSMGEFRIAAFGHIRLERPANDTGRFTFYQSGSSEASAVGLHLVSSDQLGLVTVRFRPELEYKGPIVVPRIPSREEPNRRWPRETEPFFCAGEEVIGGGISPQRSGSRLSARGLSAGGTGLSGQSDQSFYEVAGLNYDLAGEVVINLRLVCGGRVPDPRPLHPSSNPVPAPMR